jgi:hypothetical protein
VANSFVFGPAARIRQTPSQIEPILGVLKQVLAHSGEGVRKQKRGGVKKTDYEEKNAWGE